MSTYNVTGFAVEWGYDQVTDTDFVQNVSAVTLRAAFPDGQGFISYSVVDAEPEGAGVPALPVVNIGGGEAFGVQVYGPQVPGGITALPEDTIDYLGYVTTPEGTHIVMAFEIPGAPGEGGVDLIFPIAGDPLTIPTTVSEFEALDNSITDAGVITAGDYVPNVNISLSGFSGVVIENNNQVLGTVGDDTLTGTAGDDDIVGFTGNDSLNGAGGDDNIYTGGGAYAADTVVGSAGSDLIDLSEVDSSSGYVVLDYGNLTGPIDVAVDGGEDTASVLKGAGEEDTIISVENPLFAGWTDGGLLIAGTAAADTFNLNIADQQWMELRAGDGVDTITLGGAGLVRLDFRGSDNGINVDLSTNSIINDGFGNAETIIGNTPWGIRGSEHGDVFVGSSGDDKFRKVGGNDTLDGGAGQDRIRYDADGLAGLEVDLAAGTATGSINGTQFSDTISNFEHVRGSSGNDWLAGDSTGVNNILEGRGGADTFVPGTGHTYIAQFTVGVSTLDAARLGLSLGDVQTALQNATQVNFDAVVNLSNGSTLQFAGLTPADVANITPVIGGSPDEEIQGTVGDDSLVGGAGNDTLIGNGGNDNFDPGTGDDLVQVGESSVYDQSYILAGEGNDEFDFGGIVGGYVSIDYSALANAIDVTIDGVANTGTALKGVAGTDTYTGIANPLIAGNTTGGLGITGTQSDDTFDLTLASNQWMEVQGLGGNDTITINSGYVRLDYAPGGAIVADLVAGTVQQDGFTDTIAGTQGAWEIRGSDSADSILGSANDESFILRGGNDTLDGGDGFDRLRYDRSIFSGVDADLAAGFVTGNWSGGSFTHLVSNIEHLRGSNSDDILGGDTNDNELQGRGGIDIFVHVGGNDTISDFDALTETLAVRIAGLDQATIDTALGNATDVNGDALVDFGSSSVLFSGLSAAQVAGIDAQYQDPAAQNTIQGTAGDDFLEGTPGNDLIITGDATAVGDTVVGSAGDDTIDMSGMNQTTAWAVLDYSALAGTVDVTVDGVANTGSAVKSTLGTDTYTGIVNPLESGYSSGGLGILGTAAADTFDLTLGATQWMQVQGLGGNDTITINSGSVRIDYAPGGAIVADLATGTVQQDGFTDTIAGAQGAWEIRGSDSADSILGSANDESFILRGGNDTLDGGDGFDRLRYDRGIYDGGIDADLALGEITGNVFSPAGSTPFTHSISNIEHLRGTGSNDRIADDTGDNLLEGRDGDDAFTLSGGNDTVDGGTGNDSVYFDVNEAQAVVNSDGLGGHSVTIGADTITLTSIEELLFADSGATPPPPPTGPSAWTIGDPHLLTLDGLGYDFHAVGEYVLLRGQIGQDVNGFEIQSRMTETTDDLGNPVPNVSVNAAIAMRAANGSEVMIDSTDASPLSVDGVAQALADGEFLEVGADRVYRVGDTYTTVFAGGDGTLNAGDTQVSVVVHNGRVDLSVRVSSELAGKLEGLLGDGDGDKTNDVARADGTVLLRPLAFEDLYGGYRDDWRVDNEGQSLFTYDTGETLAGFYDPSKPGSVTTVDDFDAQSQQAAQQAAESAGLQPGTVNYDNAVLDFLLTGDQSFVDGAANEDVAAPETATVAGSLDQGQARAALDISVTDRAGDAVEGAQIGFSAGSSTAKILADDLTGGAYQVQVGEGTSGRAGGTMEFTNASNTITSADALDVLRLAVGLTPSWGAAEGMDFVAADINRDGQVTSADALEVLRAAVGLDSPGGTAPKWVFLDPTLDVSGADRTSVPVEEGVDIAAIGASGAFASLEAVLLGDMADFNAQLPV